MRPKQSPYQLTLFEADELERCAGHIRDDLGIDGALGYDDAVYLAEVHGGSPIDGQGDCAGETVGEEIRLDRTLPNDRAALVIVHELVHRLSNGPRYEDLNPVTSQIARRIWLELLACRVAEGTMH